MTTGAAIRAVIAGRFAAAGVPEPAQRAADFAAFIDGLLFDQIAGAGNRELTARDVRAAIDTPVIAAPFRRPSRPRGRNPSSKDCRGRAWRGAAASECDGAA